MDRERLIGASVHPLSHKIEWSGWLSHSPALRSTDYKCPHCLLFEYEYRNVSLIVLGRYSPSQNGVIVSPFGLSPCIVGGGAGHDTDVPKILCECDL